MHAAGVTRDRTLARMSSAEWRAALQVNAAAPLALDAALARAARLSRGASLVYFGSTSGLAGNAGQANYAAAKAALGGAARARRESGEGGGPVSCNVIAPGFIRTQMTARVPLATRIVGARLNALGQAGEPRDVAGAVAFLCGRGSRGVNGQVLRVCGGFMGGR